MGTPAGDCAKWSDVGTADEGSLAVGGNVLDDGVGGVEELLLVVRAGEAEVADADAPKDAQMSLADLHVSVRELVAEALQHRCADGLRTKIRLRPPREREGTAFGSPPRNLYSTDK